MEIVSGDALNAIERGQIDMQVATAKKYPRSVKAFMTEAESMICMSQETAEGCSYKLKRKDSTQAGGVKIIEGPSIRLMEIAAASYTNMRYGSRIVAIDQDYVTAQGVAIDMQKNLAITVEVQRSIKGKYGRYSNDMIMVTCNAAGSIARRNALLGIIPRVYINQLADTAKKFAIGDAKSLPERLQRAFAYFTTVLGVEQAKVLAYLDKPSMQDCTLEDLGDLQNLKTMLKDGEITIETAFSDAPAAGTAKAETPDLGDKPKPAGTAAAPPSATPTPAAPAPTTTTASTPRKKKEPKPAAPAPAAPAPETPAATAPAIDPADPAVPGPAEPAEEPVLTIARKLNDAGVVVDDFFDWLKASGRGNIYHFDPDAVQTMNDLPPKLVTDLLANDSEQLAVCIRMFATKKA